MLFQGHEQEVELQRAAHGKEIAKIKQQLVRITCLLWSLKINWEIRKLETMLYETFRILQRTRLFGWSWSW